MNQSIMYQRTIIQLAICLNGPSHGLRLQLQQSKKVAAVNRCTSVTLQCPMQHVQDFTGSHWMPPSGKYLLCIAPATARATINRPTMIQCTTIADQFYGRGHAPVLYHVHHLMEEVQGFIKATKSAIGQALTPMSINRTCLPRFWEYISSSNH